MRANDLKNAFLRPQHFIMVSKGRGNILPTFIVFLVACHSTEQSQFDDLPGPCIIRRKELPRLEPVKVHKIPVLD